MSSAADKDIVALEFGNSAFSESGLLRDLVESKLVSPDAIRNVVA